MMAVLMLEAPGLLTPVPSSLLPLHRKGWPVLAPTEHEPEAFHLNAQTRSGSMHSAILVTVRPKSPLATSFLSSCPRQASFPELPWQTEYWAR